MPRVDEWASLWTKKQSAILQETEAKHLRDAFASDARAPLLGEHKRLPRIGRSRVPATPTVPPPLVIIGSPALLTTKIIADAAGHRFD